MTFSLLNKCLLILLLCIGIASPGKAATNQQHVKIDLRGIGHNFLLALGDSTSRVLPIEQIGDRFAIRFEKEFAFEPDVLVYTVFNYFETKQLQGGFIVEVEPCDKNLVVHSFLTNAVDNPNLTACRGRVLPQDCYVFFFTPIEAETKAQLKKNDTKKGLSYGYIVGALVLGIGVFIGVKKRRKESSHADHIAIGQYAFNQKEMTLMLKEQIVELSSKEADLLFLLYANENKTLEREYILEQVWGDGGSYVGRTLDVFISKLRKKLEGDETIKIINVRGVGYRFVIN